MIKNFSGVISTLVISLLIVFGISTVVHLSEPKETSNYDKMIVKLSLSSDGRYAVTSHANKALLLWDLQHKTRHVISDHANIFSAYFIKHAKIFMWQDDETNEIIIQSVTGKRILSFNPGFATYGHVITTDLKHYFASDENWAIYAREQQQQKMIKAGSPSDGVLANSKMLNLRLSDNDQLLLTSGNGVIEADQTPIDPRIKGLEKGGVSNFPSSMFSGIVLWDVNSGDPLNKFFGNQIKTVAEISPNGKYVVSSDDTFAAYVWDIAHGNKKFALENFVLEEIAEANKNDENMDFLENSHVHLLSKESYAVKFIDDKHYIRIPENIPKAILYHPQSSKPVKILSLGDNPKPMTINDMPNEAIDTAPDVGILAISQAGKHKDGIIVYKFDAKKHELNKVWVSPT